MKVKIGTSEYNLAVLEHDDLFVERGINGLERVLGVCGHDNKQIKLAGMLPAENAEKVLLHECVHAFFHEFMGPEYEHDETLIDNLAKQIYFFLHNNDLNKLRDYVTQYSPDKPKPKAKQKR